MSPPGQLPFVASCILFDLFLMQTMNSNVFFSARRASLIGLYSIIFLLSGSSLLLAQRVSGRVVEREQSGKLSPLTGANVFWAGTTLGTTTDVEGRFSIARSSQSNRLIISFIGYLNDTLVVGAADQWEVVLRPTQRLEEVVIRGSATQVDRLSPMQTEIITTRALAKAACCNLSESFETNASVSVSYSDAVTGAKQIQMLGLNGNYIQSNVENIPTIRGLATTFGLNYIPGTWIQSIDVGKGIGSVVNGYESLTGQINVELQKPDAREKLYLNGYVNSFGRAELNLNLAHEINERWSTAFLSHASTLQHRIDNNGDDFLDLPLYTQLNAINRWKYQSDHWMVQMGVKALYEDRLGGQMQAQRGEQSATVYGFGNTLNRYEAFAKIAKLFPDKPYKGLGLILNASTHDSRSYFGFTPYDGKQNTLYSNLIYQGIIGNTNHTFKTGASYLLDDYNERYRDTTFLRTESVPGVFFEYTYAFLEKFTFVAGGRTDFHNLYGTQWTPRAHLRYALSPNTTLRASLGRGFRVPNPLAENYGNLVSGRVVRFMEAIRPEIAWNRGLSLTQEFNTGNMKGNIILDFYRTTFENQLVADFEHPGFTHFYNLDGESFANSFQVELNVEPLPRLEVKAAYRLFDVQQSLGRPFDESVLLPRMMISRDRVLFNAEYALPYDKWKFDLTVQWNGKRRIPTQDPMYVHTTYIGMPFQLAPAFFNVNAQITRTFPKWDLYLGGENLNNFRQLDPIVAADDPFGRRFDAGMVWGPVVGRMIYLGFRYKIKH